MARMDKMEVNGVKYISEDYLIEKMVDRVIYLATPEETVREYVDESNAIYEFERLLKCNFNDAELLKKFQKLYVLKRFIERGIGS